MNDGNMFYMAGTEGTGQYLVLASTARGRVGVRVLTGNVKHMSHIHEARVRVEPANANGAAREVGKLLIPRLSWKQPNDKQLRFSTVTPGERKLKRRLTLALKAIGTGVFIAQVNPELPNWANTLVSSLAGKNRVSNSN